MYSVQVGNHHLTNHIKNFNHFLEYRRLQLLNIIGKFTMKRKHIQQDHWNWPQCHICYDVIEQEKMANHLRHKHGQVNIFVYM